MSNCAVLPECKKKSATRADTTIWGIFLQNTHVYTENNDIYEISYLNIWQDYQKENPLQFFVS